MESLDKELMEAQEEDLPRKERPQGAITVENLNKPQKFKKSQPLNKI